MTIFGLHMDGAGADPRGAKITRALLGAWYGLLGGTAFSVLTVFIDIWLYPNLPLGVDWGLFGARMALVGLGLALTGALTCWWSEAWQGLAGGTIIAAALALWYALFFSEVSTGLKFLVFVFILFPIAAMTLPIVWMLRRLVERHMVVMHLPNRTVRVLRLILVVLMFGAICGYFTKMSAKGLQAVRFVHETLQNPTDANALTKLPSVQAHQGESYELFQSKSIFSTEGYDVRVEYVDGLSVTCTAVVYPGRPAYLTVCKEK